MPYKHVSRSLRALPLGEFLRRLDQEQKDHFAAACDTSLQYLRHVASGRKRPKVELCIRIEKASGLAVRCESLRPDVDWAYLSRRRNRINTRTTAGYTQG